MAFIALTFDRMLLPHCSCSWWLFKDSSGEGDGEIAREHDYRRNVFEYWGLVPQSLNARIIQVRHRSHATYSRQPRQVRKEATVTGSCECSGVPVPGLTFGFHKILS